MLYWLQTISICTAISSERYSSSTSFCSGYCSYKCDWKYFFPLPSSLASVQWGRRKTAGSPLEAWDFLPCVTVGVIAMSHSEDFVWVDVVVFLQKEGASQNTN